METKLQSKQQYPRFIQNKPCGIDKFDGGSQKGWQNYCSPFLSE